MANEQAAAASSGAATRESDIPSSDPVQPGHEASGVSSPQSNGIDDGRRIRVLDAAGGELWSFTEGDLSGGQEELCSYIYSTINNWPASRFYAAEGYPVESILRAAGVYDSAQTVTFRADDGYEISLTRQQLFDPQYYFPNVGIDSSGAEHRSPIIAYRWREGSGDPADARDDKPLFIFGQQTPFEHTNPAFVVGVSEIVVDFEPCGAWPPASTFPAQGEIEAGETVKLQHPSYGLVKLYYTLDGSDPTSLSELYNVSTYQTELNLPITITGPTVIKVLVTGYGRSDSGIATFEFLVVSG